MNWSLAWIISTFFCLALDITELVNAKWSSDSSKRDDLLGLNLGLGDDLFSSNYDTDLLKEKDKQDDAKQRAAFPIMDAFKQHTLFTADDLREKVENSYSDKVGIREAVSEALNKLHKKKEQAAAAAAEAHAPSTPNKPHVVTAKELIDEVVKQEIKNHIDHSSPGGITSVVGSDELKSKLHEKLEEISRIETKLFTLIRDVKGFLLIKKADQGTTKDDSTSSEDNDDVDSLPLDSLMSKRSDIPFNIDQYRKNVTLVKNFINDALKDDFTVDPSQFIENDGDQEDKTGPKQGDTRDLLGKEETEKALLKEAIPGEIEDIPVSNLEREIDENDSVASDHGITRDALVDSPFSDLDYKKVTSKRSRHFLS